MNEMDYEDSDPGDINCEIPVDFDKDINLDVPDNDSNVDLSDGDSFDTETNVNESDNSTSFELAGDEGSNESYAIDSYIDLSIMIPMCFCISSCKYYFIVCIQYFLKPNRWQKKLRFCDWVRLPTVAYNKF